MPITFPKCKLALFALLSLCDFVITYLLLSGSQGRVYEANPVADSWLQEWGWIGLAAFKATLVFLVALIATYVYFRRPRIAHDLLAIACGAVVVAVVTGSLIAMSKPKPAAAEEDSWTPCCSTDYPESFQPRTKDYGILLDQASSELARYDTNLANAVGVMEKSNRAGDAEWVRALRRAYPGIEDRALLAADLLQHTIGMRIRSSEARKLAMHLEGEFRELYGIEPNLPYRQMLHLAPRCTADEAASR